MNGLLTTKDYVGEKMKFIWIITLTFLLSFYHSSFAKEEEGSIVINSKMNSKCGIRMRLYDSNQQLIGKKYSLFPDSFDQELYRSDFNNGTAFIRNFLTVYLEAPLLYNPKYCKQLWKQTYSIEWKPDEKQCFNVTPSGLVSCEKASF